MARQDEEIDDERYRDKLENDLFHLFKEKVEKYFEIEKRMKPEDLVYGKHNFRIYGTVVASVSNFLTKGSNIDEM